MSLGIELALGRPMVTPSLEMSHADVCSLPNIPWRKQLQSSIVMNGALLQGGYKLPECDDSEESFGMLVSALVMFLKHWLSNQRGTEGVMQPWCIFPPIAVPDSLIFLLHWIC